MRNEEIPLSIDAFPPSKIAEQAENIGGSLLVGLVYWFAYRRKHGWCIRI